MDRLHFEKQLWSEGYTRIMGLDEVGRGCLSGPVVAAGVILKPKSRIEGVKDSKQLILSEREDLEKIIKDTAAYWTIQWCEPTVIDEINILQASLKAMHECTAQAKAKPDYLLVDGNRYSGSLYPHTCLVGGDDRSVSIAAASILAKVYRDRFMKKLHQDFPHYGWDTNVGYPTRQHFAGLKEYGITQHHRKSFNLRTHKEYCGKDSANQ